MSQSVSFNFKVSYLNRYIISYTKLVFSDNGGPTFIKVIKKEKPNPEEHILLRSVLSILGGGGGYKQPQ